MSGRKRVIIVYGRKQGGDKLEGDFSERLAILEAEDKNIFHQLDEIKSEVKDIRRLTAAVEKMAEQMKNPSCKVDAIDRRLNCVENAPAEDFKNYKQIIINCIITGILGAVIGAVLAMIIK